MCYSETFSATISKTYLLKQKMNVYLFHTVFRQLDMKIASQEAIDNEYIRKIAEHPNGAYLLIKKFIKLWGIKHPGIILVKYYFLL